MDTAPNINQSAIADVYREGTLEDYFPRQVEGLLKKMNILFTVPLGLHPSALYLMPYAPYHFLPKVQRSSICRRISFSTTLIFSLPSFTTSQPHTLPASH